jgi:Regulator of G protein signaling domain
LYFSLKEHAAPLLSNSTLPQVKELAAQDELQYLLSNKIQFQQFKQFSMKHHCAESVLFYENVTYYKQLTTKDKLDAMANLIFKQFINKNSKYEININDTARNELKTQFQLHGATVQLFDSVFAEVQLFTLMDAFLRFKQELENK